MNIIFALLKIVQIDKSHHKSELIKLTCYSVEKKTMKFHRGWLLSSHISRMFTYTSLFSAANIYGHMVYVADRSLSFYRIKCQS